MKKSKFELYNIKVIVSGDVVEIYRYEDERYKKLPSDEIEDTQEADAESDSKTKTQSQAVKSNAEYKRKLENIARTKRNLKRLIEANINQYSEKDKFITLDFAEYLSRDKVIIYFDQIKAVKEWLCANAQRSPERVISALCGYHERNKQSNWQYQKNKTCNVRLSQRERKRPRDKLLINCIVYAK